MSLIRTLTIALLATLVTACSDGDSDDKTNIRFFNAVPDIRSVDFLVDSDPYFPATGYLEGSGYIKIDTEQHEFDAIVSGSFTSLGSRRVSLQDDQDYTFMVMGRSEIARVLLIQDDNEPASESLVKVRIINAATSVRSVDVYIVSADQNQPSSAPVQNNVGFGTVSGYRVNTEGRYNIIVTESNSRTVLARSDRRDLAAENVYTVVVADSAPGRQPLRVLLIDDTQN
jgi:hypothetical protein